MATMVIRTAYDKYNAGDMVTDDAQIKKIQKNAPAYVWLMRAQTTDEAEAEMQAAKLETAKAEPQLAIDQPTADVQHHEGSE